MRHTPARTGRSPGRSAHRVPVPEPCSRRTEHRPHLGERVLIGRAGDPEVGDADRLVVGDQQVRRLDVAVDNPAPVRAVERTSGLLEPRQPLLRRNGAAFEPVSDRPVPGVLHNDERKAVRGLAHVVNRDDVRFAGEVRSGARLPQEPRVELVVARPAAREHLDRHGTPERRVSSSVDLSHAAGRDRLGRGVAGRQRGARHRHPSMVPADASSQSLASRRDS